MEFWSGHSSEVGAGTGIPNQVQSCILRLDRTVNLEHTPRKHLHAHVQGPAVQTQRLWICKDALTSGSALQKEVDGIPGALGLQIAQCTTWIPKVCKIMAFMAIIMGLGLLFYILLGSR